MTPLKRTAVVIAGQSPPSAEVSQLDGSAQPFLQGNAEFGPSHPVPIHQCRTAPKKAKIGDILLSVRAPVGALNRADQGYGIGRGLCAIRPSSTDRNYLWWALQSQLEVLQSVGTGSTYAAVTADQVGDLPLPVPESLAEQRAIAGYLDTESARIDALITKKHRLIELLNKRWQTQLRDQLASAGERTVPLRRGWTVIDCKHRTPTYVDSGYPVVSPGDATPGRLDLGRAHRFVGGEDFRDLTGGNRRPERGDIIYSRNASIGIASFVDTDTEFCMGQDVCLITSSSQSQLYLMYVLNSIGVEQLEELKLGSTFSRVNISQILDLEVPLPDLAEQQRLAREIDQRRQGLDRATATIARQIDLLVEHRQALITAAVTGELAVPGAAA